MAITISIDDNDELEEEEEEEEEDYWQRDAHRGWSNMGTESW